MPHQRGKQLVYLVLWVELTGQVWLIAAVNTAKERKQLFEGILSILGNLNLSKPSEAFSLFESFKLYGHSPWGIRVLP
jgi:hypothetical protein